MQDSVFTKIIKGEIPSHKVYEDDKTLAFLDIHPLRPGHVLVVSKMQVDDFEQLPKAEYDAIFATVQKVAKRVKEVFNSKKAEVLILGYDVPHAHIHVLPGNSSKEFYNALANHHEIIAADPDHEALAEMAKKLYFKE